MTKKTKRINYVIVVIIGFALVAGTFVFSDASNFQGKFKKIESQEENNFLKEELRELSKINPHLRYLYKDNLDIFEKNLLDGKFKNLEEKLLIDRKHYLTPNNDEELFTQQLNLYSILNIKSYKFEEKFPEFFQKKQIGIYVKEALVVTMKVDGKNLNIEEQLKENSPVIEIHFTENSYLSLSKEGFSIEKLLSSNELEVLGKNENGQVIWNLEWDKNSKTIKAVSNQLEVIWESSL
jgi:hypothetical protein